MLTFLISNLTLNSFLCNRVSIICDNLDIFHAVLPHSIEVLFKFLLLYDGSHAGTAVPAEESMNANNKSWGMCQNCKIIVNPIVIGF